MANGSGNRLILAIAIENTYAGNIGTQFPLAFITQNFKNEVDPIFNESGMGGTYRYSHYTNENKWTSFSIEAKIDENSVLIPFLQKFSISSSLVSGDSGAWEHVLTYSNNNFLKSFRFTLVDPDRGTEVYKGCLFSNIQMNQTKGQFQTLTLEGIGQKSIDTSDTVPAIDRVREFVGRHVTHQLVEVANTYANYNVITADHTFESTLSEMDVNSPMGTDTLQDQYVLDDMYSVSLNALMPNKIIRDYYNNSDLLKYKTIITDTTRNIVGSTNNTKPLISIEMPRVVVNEYTPREGGLNELLRQTFTITAIDYPSIAECPAEIKVRNNVSSY